MERKEIVRLAMDNYHNTVQGNFSKEETNDVLRNALIDANNGKTYLDIRDVRDGKCSEVFAVIEEVMTNVKNEIMTQDPYITRLVEYRNVAFGDALDIVVPESQLFVVSTIGGGSQAIRRQRLAGGQSIRVNTSWKAIKIYEEIELILAGRVNFNELIDRVARSFRAKAYADIASVWESALGGLTTPYAYSGSWDEETMMTIIEHVKAESGSNTAMLIGTAIALNKAVATHDTYYQGALEDEFKMGYSGMFNGNPKYAIRQAHVPGTTTFAFNNDKIGVIAADVKPIVYVTEGQSLILPRSYADNVDLTQEYLMMEKTGVASRIAAADGCYGLYTIS